MKQTYLAFDGQYYKIGKSKNSEQRIKHCKTANPSIELLGYGYGATENELHLKYNDKRVDREWFDLEESDVNYILKEISKKSEPIEIIERNRKIIHQDLVIDRMVEVCEQHGVKLSYVEKQLGLGNQTLVRIYERRSGVKSDMIRKFLRLFPKVSSNWIMLGENIDTENVIEKDFLISEIFNNQEKYFNDTSFQMLVEIYLSQKQQ